MELEVNVIEDYYLVCYYLFALNYPLFVSLDRDF